MDTMQAILPIALLSNQRAAEKSRDGEGSRDIDASFNAAFNSTALDPCTAAPTEEAAVNEVGSDVVQIGDLWLMVPPPALPVLMLQDVPPVRDALGMAASASTTLSLLPEGYTGAVAPPTEDGEPESIGGLKTSPDVVAEAGKESERARATASLPGETMVARWELANDAAVASKTTLTPAAVAVVPPGPVAPETTLQRLTSLALGPAAPDLAVGQSALTPGLEEKHGSSTVLQSGNDARTPRSIPASIVASRLQADVERERVTHEASDIEGLPLKEDAATRVGLIAPLEEPVRLSPPVPSGEARFACSVATAMLPEDRGPVLFGLPTEEADGIGSVMSQHGSPQWPTPHALVPASHSALPSGPVASLASHIAQSAALGEGTTEIALSPEELGEVRLSIRLHESDPGRIVVMMTFERPEAMDIFRRNADQLVADLKMAGFTGADLGFADSDAGNGRSAESDHRPSHASSVAAEAPVANVPALRPGTTSSLDLRL